MQITKEKLEQYAEDLKDYLLEIHYSEHRTYDNSDDDRVEDSESHWDGIRYCEIDPLKNAEHLVIKDDAVAGVVFFIRNNSQKVKRHVFLFDGSCQQRITMGYSASHSSSWTYITKIRLVKRGENGAPEQGRDVNFEQSEMYPSF